MILCFDREKGSIELSGVEDEWFFDVVCGEIFKSFRLFYGGEKLEVFDLVRKRECVQKD